MTDERLSPASLATLGGAFAGGYDSRAAQRFVPRLSFAPADDLSLALGWPFILELEPALGPAEPVAEVLSRLAARVPPRRWPIDLATRAVRLLAIGYLKFPNEPKPEAAAAAARAEPLAPGEAKELLATMLARPIPGWRHAPWMLSALEALADGGAVVDALFDSFESGAEAWKGVKPVPSSLISRAAYLVRRLPEPEAEPRRARAKTLLMRAVERSPQLLTDDKFRLVPSRRMVLVMDEPDLIVRGGARSDGVLSLHDAAFLPRAAFLEVFRQKGKPTEGAEASAQYVIAGGPEVLDMELDRWPSYGAGTDKPSAHAYVVEQYGAFRLPGAVALMADMAAKSAAKTDALDWLVRHAAFAEPILDELAKSRSPIKASADKALHALATKKPS